MSDSKAGKKLLGQIHQRLVFARRKKVLAQQIAALLPAGCSVLDIGCGNGSLAADLPCLVPGLHVEGVEVHAREQCAIPFKIFDGEHLPFPDKSFDVCMFIDVLHHSETQLSILRDACRVSKKFIVIKDHTSESFLDYWTLRLMDWVGNAPHGVALPYCYLSQGQFAELVRQLSLRTLRTEDKLPLYPALFSWIFGRGLHFVALLQKAEE